MRLEETLVSLGTGGGFVRSEGRGREREAYAAALLTISNSSATAAKLTWRRG